jgi:hypothetical protein
MFSKGYQGRKESINQYTVRKGEHFAAEDRKKDGEQKAAEAIK